MVMVLAPHKKKARACRGRASARPARRDEGR